jgi:hypothetical protein
MKILLISMLFFVACSTGVGQDDKNQVNSNTGKNMSEGEKKKDTRATLSRETAKAISKAKKVVVYEIREFVTDRSLQEKDKKKYFANYEVVNFKDAGKGQVKEIKSILLDVASYADKEFVDKCPFTASIGLEFISGRKVSTKIIVSFQCKQILVFEGNKETYKDLSSIEKIDKTSREILNPPPKPAARTDE